MPDGNDCPECGANIGILAVLKAPMPNRIYCPKCKARLRYGGTDIAIAAAVGATALVAAAAIAAYYLGFSFGPIPPFAIAMAVLVGGIAALEVVFVLTLWYGSYELEPVNRPAIYGDDEF